MNAEGTGDVARSDADATTWPSGQATTTDEMLAAAREYAEQFAPARVGARPRRRVAVVACMDVRLDLFGMLGLAAGDAHVLRNAGGTVTDDVERSLVVSQGLLGTEEVVLVHHTCCGLLGDEEELRGRLTAAGTALPPFPLGAFADLEADVGDGVRRLRASPYLRHRDRIRGFVFDVESGRLHEVRVEP